MSSRRGRRERATTRRPPARRLGPCVNTPCDIHARARLDGLSSLPSKLEGDRRSHVEIERLRSLPYLALFPSPPPFLSLRAIRRLCAIRRRSQSRPPSAAPPLCAPLMWRGTLPRCAELFAAASFAQPAPRIVSPPRCPCFGDGASHRATDAFRALTRYKQQTETFDTRVRAASLVCARCPTGPHVLSDRYARGAAGHGGQPRRVFARSYVLYRLRPPLSPSDARFVCVASHA